MANQTEKPDDEKAIREILRAYGPDVSVPSGFEPALLQRVKARMRADQAPAPAGFVRRHAWAFRAATAAACLALAALVGWHLLGGDVPSASAGFSDMLRNVCRATSASFDQVLRISGQPDVRSRMVMAVPGRFRATWPDGRVQIMNQPEGKGLSFSASTRKASLLLLSGGGQGVDPLDDLRKVDKSEGRLVGKEIVAGQTTLLYEVARPQWTMRVWVEPQQELPLRIEVRSRLGGKAEVVTVLENFSWNQAVADSLFSLQPPAGYALNDVQGRPTEEALRELLRVCCQARDGLFPERLDPQGIFDTMARKYHWPSGDQNIPGVTYSREDDEQAKKDYRNCLRGLAFVEQISAEGAWAYAGNGAKLGDGGTIVCWWKPAGSDTYRVLYGDLRIRDMTRKELFFTVEH